MHRFPALAAIVVLLLFGSLPASARADMPLSEYELLKHSSSFADYMVGVGRGIFWANSVLEVTQKRSLFCMPRKLALDKGIILSMLEQEVRSPTKNPPEPSTPLELILVKSFTSRFPCKPPKAGAQK